MKGFSIAGIGTDVGKTIVSALIVEAVKGAYFKPVQAGDLDRSDSIKIKEWCSSEVEVLPEIYRLTEPMAPHAAAELDGVKIVLRDITLPSTKKPLILEGAGGILVPLNEDKESMLDLYEKANLPVILVSRNYLGSINHTLMTIEILRSRDLSIHGIVYVGEPSEHTESIIERFTGVTCIGRVSLPEEEVNTAYIKLNSKQFEGLIYDVI